MEDLESIESIALVETCIICLSDIDEKGKATICSSKLLKTPNCNCKYAVHKECLEHWQETRPRQNTDLQCLICSSKVELHQSFMDSIYETSRVHAVKCMLFRHVLYLLIVITGIFIIYGPFSPLKLENH